MEHLLTVNCIEKTKVKKKRGHFLRMTPVVNLGLLLQVKAHVDTLYFWDGVRKIDIVLAFVDPSHDSEEEAEKIVKRNVFIRNLEAQGLHLELETSKVT